MDEQVFQRKVDAGGQKGGGEGQADDLEFEARVREGVIVKHYSSAISCVIISKRLIGVFESKHGVDIPILSPIAPMAMAPRKLFVFHFRPCTMCATKRTKKAMRKKMEPPRLGA